MIVYNTGTYSAQHTFRILHAYGVCTSVSIARCQCSVILVGLQRALESSCTAALACFTTVLMRTHCNCMYVDAVMTTHQARKDAKRQEAAQLAEEQAAAALKKQKQAEAAAAAAANGSTADHKAEDSDEDEKDKKKKRPEQVIELTTLCALSLQTSRYFSSM
jgi:hypothetical protein